VETPWSWKNLALNHYWFKILQPAVSNIGYKN